MVIDINDFLELRASLPMVDVRSEKEFADGHIPKATNIPILNNSERATVGTEYKQKGQLQAIKTGFRLVGPRIVDIVSEAEKISGQGELLVHCWRGGMRSANFCYFMEMAKVKTHQLRGGYKAYRNKVVESFNTPLKLIVIGGSTGSGKSDVLRVLEKKGQQVLDLERLANHRGSAFGGLKMPQQPSTEQFQNNLFEEILKLDISRPVWVEDESIGIGKVFVPDGLWKYMSLAPLVELRVDKLARVERLVNEYGDAGKGEFLSSMEKITKKLGGQHFQKAKEKLLIGDMHATIEILLTYYDKAYATGLAKKQQRIAYRADWNGVDIDSLADELIAATPSHVTPTI